MRDLEHRFMTVYRHLLEKGRPNVLHEMHFAMFVISDMLAAFLNNSYMFSLSFLILVFLLFFI